MTEIFQQAEETILKGEAWLKVHAESIDLGELAPQWQIGTLRRQNERLISSSTSRGCLTMFGASQAGKSYVVGSLAAVP